MGRDVAEQSQELALHPPFPPLPSRREPVLGDPGGVRQPPVEEVRPAERPDAAGPPPVPLVPLGEATGGVLHQGDPLGAAAGPVVRRAQCPGEVVEQQGHLSRPAEIEAALQRGHGAGEVALIELEGAEAEEGRREARRRAPPPPRCASPRGDARTPRRTARAARARWQARTARTSPGWRPHRIAPAPGPPGSARARPRSAGRPRGTRLAPHTPGQEDPWATTWMAMSACDSPMARARSPAWSAAA